MGGKAGLELFFPIEREVRNNGEEEETAENGGQLVQGRSDRLKDGAN